MFAPLSASGLGGPNPRATNNPLLFLAFGAAALSPALALRVFLFATLALAGMAADLAAARVFSVRRAPARLVAGLMYMASPFFATKLVSGHLYFFLCAPLVPLAFVAADAIPAGGRRAWAGLAACIAGALAQLQVGAALMIALAIVSSRRGAALAAAAAAMVAVATFAPTIYSGASAYALGALSTETQLLEWVRQNSVPLGHVLDGTSYFTRYYEAYAGVWTARLWQVVTLLCVAVAALRGGTPRRLAIASIVLGVVASGTRGPLAGAVNWTFIHIPAASAFRELYDLLAIAPFVVAGGASIMLEWLLSQPTSVRLRATEIAGALAFAGCFWPAPSAVAARALPLVSSATWSATVQAVDAQPGVERVLWLPDEIPIGPPGSAGGADPFSNAIGMHPAANAYHPDGILAYASAYADQNGFLPEDLARKLGIAQVIDRPGLVSTLLENAAFGFQQTIVPPERTSSVISGGAPLALLEAQPACQPALRSQMLDDLAYAVCPRGWVQSPVESLDSRDDPRREWVSGQRWAALDFRLAEPRWPVLFTLSALPYVWHTPSAGYVWVYSRSLATLDRKRLPTNRWTQLAISAGEHVLVGDGKHIVAVSASVAWREPQREAPERAQRSPVMLLHVDRAFGRYDALLPPHARSVLILRERWSPFWSARLDGAPLHTPWRADDYAAGWSLPDSKRQSAVSIRYSAAIPYDVLAGISWLIWIALCVAMLVPRRTTVQDH